MFCNIDFYNIYFMCTVNLYIKNPKPYFKHFYRLSTVFLAHDISTSFGTQSFEFEKNICFKIKTFFGAILFLLL